jgi:metal-sulfur cluster biosynthetic enzyme
VATVTQDEVLSALKQCYDPEIPVNIVDLGLIYDVHFEAAPEEKQDVKIDMTLTSQGCPAHVMIGEQVKARLEQLPGIRNASVNVVWTPPWSPERLSPEARKQLGIEKSIVSNRAEAPRTSLNRVVPLLPPDAPRRATQHSEN